jgi:protein-tyrosine phosphatase
MTNPVVESAETTPPFTILTVCTGNICRSPLAEQLLHARLTAAGVTVTVLSAGTNAMVGHGMTAEAAELSTHFGGEPAAHVARLLTEELIAGADLVLTATREHRSEVVSLHPRASRYTYTLNQFARLVAQVESPTVVPVERPLDTFVAEISATRGFAPPPASPTDDDIIDPYRQSQTVYDEAGKAIDAAVRIITRALASATGRR